MGDFFGAIFACTLVTWLALCTIVVPVLMFNAWLETRDCQLIHQQACHWVIMPAEGTDR